MSKHIAKYLRRLEAATLRLEDMASSTIPLSGSQTLVEPAAPAALSAPAAPTVSPPTPSAPAAPPVPESVERFDEFMTQTVQKYVKTSNVLGGLVAEQVHTDPGNHLAGIERSADRFT